MLLYLIKVRGTTFTCIAGVSMCVSEFCMDRFLDESKLPTCFPQTHLEAHRWAPTPLGVRNDSLHSPQRWISFFFSFISDANQTRIFFLLIVIIILLILLFAIAKRLRKMIVPGSSRPYHHQHHHHQRHHSYMSMEFVFTFEQMIQQLLEQRRCSAHSRRQSGNLAPRRNPLYPLSEDNQSVYSICQQLPNDNPPSYAEVVKEGENSELPPPYDAQFARKSPN